MRRKIRRARQLLTGQFPVSGPVLLIPRGYGEQNREVEDGLCREICPPDFPLSGFWGDSRCESLDEIDDREKANCSQCQ